MIMLPGVEYTPNPPIRCIIEVLDPYNTEMFACLLNHALALRKIIYLPSASSRISVSHILSDLKPDLL